MSKILQTFYKHLNFKHYNLFFKQNLTIQSLFQVIYNNTLNLINSNIYQRAWLTVFIKQSFSLLGGIQTFLIALGPCLKLVFFGLTALGAFLLNIKKYIKL